MNITSIKATILAGLTLAVAACATPKEGIYSSILPEGYQLQTSAAPIDPASLKAKKLIVVASANFNRYAKEWADFYERGGDRSDVNMALRAFSTSTGFGVPDSSYDLLGKARDPRQFSDKAIAALEPYFASVGVAADLATAREQGAQYYGVIDYWFSGVYGNAAFSGESHVTLLDEALVETVRVGGSDTQYRSMLPLGDVIADDAAIVRHVVDTNIAQIKSGLAARLGPPSVSKPVSGS